MINNLITSGQNEKNQCCHHVTDVDGYHAVYPSNTIIIVRWYEISHHIHHRLVN